MFLFFKNGIKQLFKDKIQFAIYMILVTLAIIFSSTFGIAASFLVKSSDLVSNIAQNYNYSYKYTSSNYSANDTATLSPWFAFDAEQVTTGNEIGINAFPTLTIGTNGVLKSFEFKYDVNQDGEFTYDSTIYKQSIDDYNWINFHFGDVESDVYNESIIPSYAPKKFINELSQNERYDVVKSGNFGSFYRLNLNNENFKKSLIGMLYKKFDFFNANYNKANDFAKNAADNIFWYMFYLNNSSITTLIKQMMLNYFETIAKNDKNDIEQKMTNFVNGDGSNKVEINDISELNSGLNGRIGWILNDGSKKEYTLGFTDANDFKKRSQVEYDLDVNRENLNEILECGSYFVKNYESSDIFKTLNVSSAQAAYAFNNKILTNRSFFSVYNSMLGSLADFDITNISQVVMWDIGRVKFRYISAFYSESLNDNKEIVKFYNPNLIHIYEQRDDSSQARKNFMGHSFMVSAGYAQSHKMEFGKTYNIIPGNDSSTNLEFIYDANGVDSLNTYPTIYDEDILSNKDNEAIFYLNNTDFSTLFNAEPGDTTSAIDNNMYQDVSRIYMRYVGKNKSLMESSMETYSLYLANNLSNFAKTLDGINNLNDAKNNQENKKADFKNLSASSIQPYSETGTINLRSSLLPSVAKIFLIVAIIFSLIFILCISFVIWNIVKKFLNAQKSQLGNLKSLGVRKTKLIINFAVYMTMPIVILVPLGWGLAIGLEHPVMNVFHNYFNIPNLIPVDWKFLLVEWSIALVVVASLVWFVSWRTIRLSPLKLLNDNSNIKKTPFLAKMISKMHFKKFTTKLRSIIITTSIRDIVTYSLVFFVASIVLTGSLLIPGTLKKMTSEFYENVHYENRYDYSYNYSNVPTTQYDFYNVNNNDESLREQNELNASSLNSYFIADDKYISILDNSQNPNYWTNGRGNFANYFESILLYNLMALKGTSLSVSDFDNVLKNAPDNSKTTVNDQINNLSCQLIPKLFGQKEIDTSDFDPYQSTYSQCIKQVANNIIPSTVKQMWEQNENEFNLFTIDLNKINFDSNVDEMFTSLDGYLGDNVDAQKPVYIFGLNPDSKNQNLKVSNQQNFLTYDNKNLNNKIIPVTVNQKLKIKGVKINDIEPLYIKDNKAYLTQGVKKVVIDNSWWTYGDNKTPLENVDLSHLTYLNTKDYGAKGKDLYYKADDGTFKKYANAQDILLTIPASVVMDKAFQNQFNLINESYKEYSGKGVTINSDGSLTVAPFDVRHYDANGNPEPISLVSLASGGDQSSWWNLAVTGKKISSDSTNNNLLSEPLIQGNDATVDSGYKVKVVGYQDLYDGSSMYMNQAYANAILGFANPENEITIGDTKINVWSNAKMSADEIISDQMRHILFQSNIGDTSFSGVSQKLNRAISTASYVGKTKEMTNQLVISIYSLGIIFIIMAITASLIIIYLITDLFVGRLKPFMSFMRVQGYTMSEINSIILWTFLPVAVAAIVVGELLVYLLLHFLVPSMLLKVDIAVPLSLNNWMMLAVFAIGIVIFATAYFVVIEKMKRIKLATLTGQI